jgi:hypothetical protein
MSPDQQPTQEVPVLPAADVAEVPDTAIHAAESIETAAENSVANEEAPDLIGMPPGYEPKPVEILEPTIDANAQAIAQANIIQNQAMMERMTPPAPGTPVETFVPPVMTESAPVVETAPVAPQPPEFTTEAVVEAANRVSEPAAETPETPQQ